MIPGVLAISSSSASLILLTEPNLRNNCFLLLGPTPGTRSKDDLKVDLLRLRL